MAIAMRINYTDVLREQTLKNTYVNGNKIGFQFDIRLSYYRGHFLSVIDELNLKVDGIDIAAQDMVFCLGEKEFGINQLRDAVNDFWRIDEAATIKVFHEGGLLEGDHEIDFHLVFRSPYMPIGENVFMPWDSSECKVMTVK